MIANECYSIYKNTKHSYVAITNFVSAKRATCLSYFKELVHEKKLKLKKKLTEVSVNLLTEQTHLRECF